MFSKSLAANFVDKHVIKINLVSHNLRNYNFELRIQLDVHDNDGGRSLT